MAFSVNLIELASEADALLKMATRDKRTLQNRKESLKLRTENSAENNAEKVAELAASNASLASTISLIATLPDGELKEDEEIKKMELELKIKKLSRPGSKLSAVSLLEQEYDADLQERQIAGIEVFITEVTARKAAL